MTNRTRLTHRARLNGGARESQHGKPRPESRRRDIAEALRDAETWVYYLPMHGLIKIGCTKDLRNRVLCFGMSITDLLAVEAAGFDVERQRHEQFAASLARGREYFHPTADLIEHINAIRVRAGLPAIC